MKISKIKRRNFLKTAAGAAAFSVLPGSLFKNSRSPDQKPGLDFTPDIEFDLTAHLDEIPILPGNRTKVWRFSGEVKKGRKDALQSWDDHYLGPIFRVKKGEKIRVVFKSDIDEITIVHWHGLHVPPEMDGHPQHVIEKGEKYVYEFEVQNRGGTYWFHPHPHEFTGPQVYSGLAGLFIVSDDEEEELNLPSGDAEIPIIIQDRTFNPDNQLVYLFSPMDRMTGFLGDEVIVNGKKNFSLDLDSKAYRLRLLNGSNSRIYKLAWSDSTPFTVIGTDGGLLEKPVQRKYLTFGPAERYDILVDFSDKEKNQKIKLVSLSFPSLFSGMGGMMRRRMMGQDFNSLDMGERMDLLTINIKNKVSEKFNVPSRLSSMEKSEPQEAVNYARPRQFVFGMGGHMRWTINRRTFQIMEVADWEKVKLNTEEVWEFINSRGGMGMMGGMMEMPHPVHIHGLQFRIIERKADRSFARIFNSFKDGFVDQGWKDSFLLLPRTRVKVLLRFKDYKGMYLYHCHNLEHEDMGMMRNYLIE